MRKAGAGVVAVQTKIREAFEKMRKDIKPPRTLAGC
jgi:hypothetical protein